MQSTRRVLRLNALTCVTFSSIFFLLPNETGLFLGAFPGLYLQFIGVGLFAHGLHLALSSFKQKLSSIEVFYFSIGDIAWYLASLALLVATDYVTSTAGIFTTLLVAGVVMLIGLAQVWTYAENTGLGLPANNNAPLSHADYLPEQLSRLMALGVSWMGMKPWVKVWLVWLNIIFILSLMHWPSQLAQVVIASYVATLPLMLIFAIPQRGQTRLLGVGHLLPWLPLMAYLALRLSGDLAGAQITQTGSSHQFFYVITLFLTVGICLVFDVYDVARWFKGERGRLGSETENAKALKLETR